MMEVTCPNCAKMYRVNETKIKGQRAKLKCRACEHIIIVTKPAVDQPSAITKPQKAPAARPEPNKAPAPKPRQPEPAPAAAEPAPKIEKPTPEQTAPEETKPLSGRKPRFGLFAKFTMVMLAVSILPLIIFWTITYRETVKRNRADAEMLMALTAQDLSNRVENWINDNIWILRSASELPAIVSMNRQLQEKVLRDIQKKYPYMYLVFTVGLDGRNTARSDDVPLKDYSDRDYYKQIIKGKQLSWQNLIGKTSKKPALVLAVPIKNGNRLVGVMAAAMNLDEVSRFVVTWSRGETGYAYLIDEKGNVVAHQRRAYVVKQKNMNRQPLIASYKKGSWTTHSAEFTDENGHKALGHVRATNYGWALALQQDISEVYAHVKGVQIFAVILLIATIVLVSLVAFFSARAIVNPIKKLTDIAERMSLGDLNIQINVPSKDEIGMLAQAIKRMQTSLRLAMERLRRKR